MVQLYLELGYFAAVNLVAFALMGIDKQRAKKHLWRIPERTLFAAALVGGSVGALLSMYLFHHKTRHWYFVVGMPLILVAQLAAGCWLLAGRI